MKKLFLMSILAVSGFALGSIDVRDQKVGDEIRQNNLTDLMDAALDSDEQSAKRILANGNVDINGDDINVPLVTAAMSNRDVDNYFNVVKLLVESGADINKKSNYYPIYTPLRGAMANGRYNAVQYLISKGVIIDDLTLNGARAGRYLRDTFPVREPMVKLLEKWKSVSDEYNGNKNKYDSEFKDKSKVEKETKKYMISDLANIVAGYAGHDAKNSFEYFVYNHKPEMIEEYEKLTVS